MKDLKCEEKNVVDLVGKTRKKEREESGRLKERKKREKEVGKDREREREIERESEREKKTDREKEVGKMCVCKYYV